MRSHTITGDEVYKAALDVTNRYIQIVTGPARHGGRKRINYNPYNCTYQVMTDTSEATFRDADAAARHYSDK